MYLGPRHPVAEVAARHCVEHKQSPQSRVGGVACGACWERAIRDDERAAVEFGVPREFEPDPSYVDEVAVERALQGEAVALTRVERSVVRNRRKALQKQKAGRKVPWNRLRRMRVSATDWKGRPTSAPAKPRKAAVTAAQAVA